MVSYFIQRCLLTYEYGVRATPTVDEGLVFYPTWNGLFVALDYAGSEILWQINVSDVIRRYSPVTAEQLMVR